MSQWDSDLIDEQNTDGIKILERLVFDLDVPTIAVINARSGVRVLSRRHGTAGIGRDRLVTDLCDLATVES